MRATPGYSPSSIKIYDKFGHVLRIETTTNDVSAFKHYRKVEHRQGPTTPALAPVRKTIYSLKDLREILLSCNRRYLEYLSSLKSCFRSAISPWIDRRQQVDIIRDKLDARGIALLRQSELVS